MANNSPLQTYRTIAVTGHRTIHHASAIRKALGKFLSDLGLEEPILLTSLAEGADRLAAHEILRLSNARIRAVLPFSPEEYISDFQSSASRNEWNHLLSLADEIVVMPPRPTRTQAYLAAACHIVDKCDFLLAVWDGKPARGEGGTAEVVAYAREQKRPLVIFDSEDPTRVVRENWT